MDQIGLYGFSWSSSSFLWEGIYERSLAMRFQFQAAETTHEDYRAHSFQLRCLSE
ncbi:hypothetical protein [uncultured Rikenella sp.]|uniref:hypothetical protein n=1 Tax=uncultured Rikenella sp. TaxID=368003 RepID=UPI00272C4164|nr:hypothetical protein [uncultured Rikenella sp.]